MKNYEIAYLKKINFSDFPKNEEIGITEQEKDLILDWFKSRS